jgi:hypothetical protein
LDEDDAQYQVCGLASEALALRINPHAIAADISELFRSLDKPPLAQLPFFIGC